MRTVFIIGGFSRNYGDLAIYLAQTHLLTRRSPHKIHCIPINTDIGHDGDVPVLNQSCVNMMNKMGDLVILGGGGQLMPRSSGTGWQFNMSSVLIDQLDIPLVVMSIGLNTFPYGSTALSAQTLDHVGHVYRKADAFSVRDSATKNVLAATGIRNVEVTADSAVHVPYAIPDMSSTIGSGAPYMILQWAGDRYYERYGRGPLMALVRSICAGIDAISDTCETAPQIMYVPHVSKYDYDAFPLFQQHLGVRLVDASTVLGTRNEHLGAVPLLAGLYRGADLVLGVRGHSNILAYAMDTPWIGLGGQPKVVAFNDDVCGVMIKDLETACPDDYLSAARLARARRYYNTLHCRQSKTLLNEFIDRAVHLI